MKKILIISNTAHHIYGRSYLLGALDKLGYQLYLLVPNDGSYYVKLCNMGFECYDAIVSWKGQNPWLELKTIAKLKKIIHKIAPDLICSFTIKPNLYSAIAVKNTPIKQIANITGLGSVFIAGGVLSKIVTKLYKFAFKKIDYIFFQNNEDKNLFDMLKITSAQIPSYILPGDGVDLDRFDYIGLSNLQVTKFLYSGRLLYDKGIRELIVAFEIVKKVYPMVELIFIGDYFPDNPSAVNQTQIDRWVADGLITYLGMVDNVAEVLASVDCVVLPSYREGMPRALLEASSMGKPIITVDSVGCRNVVEDGVTGFMAKVKDVESLAQAMLKFMGLTFQEKVIMGLNGRKKMEQEFNQKVVTSKYLEVVADLLGIKV